MVQNPPSLLKRSRSFVVGSLWAAACHTALQRESLINNLDEKDNSLLERVVYFRL
jgi:hypothetical protein